MATKSFLKTVDIRDRKMSKDFIVALENASHASSKPVTMSRMVSIASVNDINKIFGDKK